MGRISNVVEITPGVFEFISTYKPTSRRAYFFRAQAVLKRTGRDLRKCEECNYMGNQIHLHHEDQDITNSRSDNLRVLCIKCHKKKHPERLQFRYEDIYPDYKV
jgi:5-methylcytosine-specific restriction endonuclease McrA